METLEEWIIELKKADKLIIVEGLKDKKALESFEIKNIIHLNKPIFEIAEEISEKYEEVIILTDFDKEGKDLYGKLSKNLVRNGVKIDKKFREWLQKNTKLSHIEGFASYFEKDLKTSRR